MATSDGVGPGTLFTDLALAAYRDGRVAVRERALLERYRQELGLSRERADEIVRRVHAGEVREYLIPRAQDGRRRVYEAVRAMVLVDGTVAPEERAMLAAVANYAGVPREKWDRALPSRSDPARAVGRDAASEPWAPDFGPRPVAAVTPLEDRLARRTKRGRGRPPRHEWVGGVAMGALIAVAGLIGMTTQSCINIGRRYHDGPGHEPAIYRGHDAVNMGTFWLCAGLVLILLGVLQAHRESREEG